MAFASSPSGQSAVREEEEPYAIRVYQVLTNPKYIGINISNRRSFKLKHLSQVRGDRGSRSLNFMAPE